MRRPALLILVISSLFSLLFQTVFAEPLSVTAVVPANVSNFSATIASDKSTPVGQDTVLTYTLSYSSTLDTETPVTLEAFWSRGTVENSGTTVDIVSYVAGSATQGYGSTSPVIDLINRKITWDISSFPGQLATQQVIFQLRTSITLTNNDLINFTINGHLKGPGLTTTDSTVTNQFQSLPVASPTLTPNPPMNTPTPSSGSSPTPTTTSQNPTPSAPDNPTTANISIRTITSTDATISIVLDLPRSISLSYGKDPSHVTTLISDPKLTTNHLIQIKDLTPGTPYYFKVAYGQRTSDIYILTTALPGEVPSPLLPSLVVTSGNTILTNPLWQESSPKNIPRVIALPTEATYDFRITIPNNQDLKNVQAVLRNSNALAASSDTPNEDYVIDLIQLSPTVYSGRLVSPTKIGNFTLFLRISDKKGAIVEQKITTFKIINPFTIHDSNGNPVEAAKVSLSYYDPQKKSYIFLNPQAIGVTNPNFSDANGKVDFVLPNGKYRAEISLLRYKSKTVDFIIGGEENNNYPDVTLISQPFSIASAIIYYGSTIRDLIYVKTHSYVIDLSHSRRVLDLVSFSVLTSFLLLLVVSFMTKAQLSLLMLPQYLRYLYRRLIRHEKVSHNIEGIVLNSTDENPIQGVTIYAIDHKSDRIIGHAITNKQGKFNLGNLLKSTYTLSFVKNGYRPFTYQSISPQLSPNNLIIGMTNHEYHRTFPHFLLYLLLFILEKGFVGILVVSFLFCLIIEVQLGWHEVIPYLILASFNLLTWFLHERYRKVSTL